MTDFSNLAGLTIKLKIPQAKDLVAKDKSMFGKKTGSDPFIRIHVNGRQVGYTSTIKKTVNPEWNYTGEFHFGAEEVDGMLKNNRPIELCIFDLVQ